MSLPGYDDWLERPYIDAAETAHREEQADEAREDELRRLPFHVEGVTEDEPEEGWKLLNWQPYNRRLSRPGRQGVPQVFATKAEALALADRMMGE